MLLMLPNKHHVRHYQPLIQWAKAISLQHLNKIRDLSYSATRSRWHKARGNLVFIVGCGHTGTTLVASRLGAHPDCFLLPKETNAFNPSTSISCSNKRVSDWLEIADSLGCLVTVEKTPKHIHQVGRIKKAMPYAKFILISRNPVDTVASLYSRFGCLKSSIARYNSDNKALLCWAKTPNCISISYENLVRDPDDQLSKLQAFAGLRTINVGVEAAVYGNRDPRNLSALERRRAKQVAKTIQYTSRWMSRISLEQAEIIIERTRSVSQDLGYPVDEMYKLLH